MRIAKYIELFSSQFPAWKDPDISRNISLHRHAHRHRSLKRNYYIVHVQEGLKQLHFRTVFGFVFCRAKLELFLTTGKMEAMHKGRCVCKKQFHSEIVNNWPLIFYQVQSKALNFNKQTTSEPFYVTQEMKALFPNSSLPLVLSGLFFLTQNLLSSLWSTASGSAVPLLSLVLVLCVFAHLLLPISFFLYCHYTVCVAHSLTLALSYLNGIRLICVCGKRCEHNWSEIFFYVQKWIMRYSLSLCFGSNLPLDFISLKFFISKKLLPNLIFRVKLVVCVFAHGSLSSD